MESSHLASSLLTEVELVRGRLDLALDLAGPLPSGHSCSPAFTDLWCVMLEHLETPQVLQ